MKVTYSSNNSGGGWWLKDKDWKNLEKRGWHIIWGGLYFCHSRYKISEKVPEKYVECAKGTSCNGHRLYESANEEERWLGALAKEATKDFNSITEAIKEFETVTKQDVTDEGCNCCGAPHTFTWDDNYASGENLAEYLYGADGQLSKRELLEKLNNNE